MGINSADIRGLTEGDTEALALTDGIIPHTVVGAENLTAWRDEGSFFFTELGF